MSLFKQKIAIVTVDEFLHVSDGSYWVQRVDQTGSRWLLMCENHLQLWRFLPKKSRPLHLMTAWRVVTKEPIRHLTFLLSDGAFMHPCANLQRQTVLLGDNKLPVLLILGSVWRDDAFNQPGPMPRLHMSSNFTTFHLQPLKCGTSLMASLVTGSIRSPCVLRE